MILYGNCKMACVLLIFICRCIYTYRLGLVATQLTFSYIFIYLSPNSFTSGLCPVFAFFFDSTIKIGFELFVHFKPHRIQTHTWSTYSNGTNHGFHFPSTFGYNCISYQSSGANNRSLYLCHWYIWLFFDPIWLVLDVETTFYLFKPTKPQDKE